MTSLDQPGRASELSQGRQPVDHSEAAEIARSLYGVEGKLTRFQTEKDDTFRVDGAGRERFVLKIAHPSEHLDELDFQTALMRHVRERAPDLPTPTVYRSLDGQELPVVETHGGERRAVRLLTFLPGTPLDRVPSNAEQRERIGALLARLRHATADFRHPADSRRMAWDVTNLADLGDLMGHVPGDARREWTQIAFDRCLQILPELKDCRRQVLHNDFNTSNLMVDPATDGFVTGIIDFGDAVRTVIAVDVSTALMNQIPKVLGDEPRRDLFDEPRDILRGYLRHADLTEDELRLIPFLAMGRLAVRALLTCWRAELFPENSPYVMRNTEAGWTHLRWFSSLSTAQISDLLMR